MLNLGCGQYLRNPFFPGFWGQKWGCGLCILADYTRLYTVPSFAFCIPNHEHIAHEKGSFTTWLNLVAITLNPIHNVL